MLLLLSVKNQKHYPVQILATFAAFSKKRNIQAKPVYLSAD